MQSLQEKNVGKLLSLYSDSSILFLGMGFRCHKVLSHFHVSMMWRNSSGTVIYMEIEERYGYSYD